MDEDEFLNAFASVNILQIEAVAYAIGRAVAKLRAGMVGGGMTELRAETLILETQRVFFETLARQYAAKQEEKPDGQ